MWVKRWITKEPCQGIGNEWTRYFFAHLTEFRLWIFETVAFNAKCTCANDIGGESSQPFVDLNFTVALNCFVETFNKFICHWHNSAEHEFHFSRSIKFHGRKKNNYKKKHEPILRIEKRIITWTLASVSIAMVAISHSQHWINALIMDHIFHCRMCRDFENIENLGWKCAVSIPNPWPTVPGSWRNRCQAFAHHAYAPDRIWSIVATDGLCVELLVNFQTEMLAQQMPLHFVSNRWIFASQTNIPNIWMHLTKMLNKRYPFFFASLYLASLLSFFFASPSIHCFCFCYCRLFWFCC